jgi:ribosomal protein S3AE
MNSQLRYMVFDEEGFLVRRFSTKVNATQYISNKDGFKIKVEKKETKESEYHRVLREVGECLL